jgi:hypothetical protein
MSKKA